MCGDVHIVGHDDEGDPALAVQSPHQCDDLLAGFAVDLAGRLVTEDQRGLVDQRPRDRGALPFASGHLVGPMVHPIVQAHFLEQRGGARLAIRAGPVVAKRKHHVLDGIKAREQIEILEDESDFLAAQIGAGAVAQFACVHLVQQDLAARRAEQQAQQVEGRGLATAGPADHGDELTRFDGQAYPVKGLDGRRALAVVLGQVRELDGCHVIAS